MSAPALGLPQARGAILNNRGLGAEPRAAL